MTKSEIQLVRSLGEKRARSEYGLFVAEGEKLIGEMIQSPLNVRKIYSLEGVFEGDNVEWISPSEMQRISQLKSANNSVALVELPRYKLDIASLRDELTLVLDGVQNPGNLGTIIRLADWYGIKNIICSPSSADCYNPKVVQATMGAILRVNIFYCDLDSLLDDAVSMSIPIYGPVLEQGRHLYETEISKSGIIVMGSEGQGISASVVERLTHRIFVSPYPADRSGSESLNVAICAAVVCAEFRRR